MSSVGEAAGVLIGGAVGFVASGGNPAGALQGAAVGGSIGAAIDPADQPGYDGPRLNDLTEQTHGFGVGLHYCDGKVKVPGHVFWIENNRRKRVIKKEKVDGGKGGGGSQETRTEEYYGTFAVLLADHPIQSVARIWDSRGLLINNTSDDNGTTIASSEIFPLAPLYDDAYESTLKAALAKTPTVGPKGQIRLYPGHDDALPDPRIEADLGIENTPAMRGRAYLVFYDWPLPQEYGQSIAGAQISAELVVNGDDDDFALLSTVTVPFGYDDPFNPTKELPFCNYLTKDRSVFWTPNYNGNGSGASNILRTEINLETYTRISSDGITRYQFAEKGTTDDPDFYMPDEFYSAPTNLTFYAHKNDRFWGYRAGGSNQGLYTWLTTSMLNHLYISTARPYGVTADDDGNAYVLFNGSIKKYNDVLTQVDSLSIGWGAGAGVVFTDGNIRIVYTSGLIYIVFFSTGSTHYVYCMPSDFSEQPSYIGSVSGFTLSNTILAVSVLYNFSGSVMSRFGVSSKADETRNFAQVQNYKLPTANSDGDDLAAVVRRRLERSELIEPGDIDVTDLAGITVRGYDTVGVGSVRGHIEPLMLAYNFDLIPDGYKIKAVLRGNASVATIDPADLDARPFGNASGAALSQSREMDSQLPSRVVVRHMDAERDYEPNEQYSQTQSASRSVNIQEVDLPIVFTPTEAAGVAETIWARRWLERASFNFSLPPTYRHLQPTDVVTLPMDYATYEFLIKRALYNVDGTVQFEAALNDSAIYNTNAVGGAATGSATTVSFGGNSAMTLLDIPAIKDVYDAYGFPAALSGYADSWPGGVIARSDDSGQTWKPIQAYSGPVTGGVVATPLGQDDGYVINYADQLTVQFYNPGMSIASITEEQMKTGMNWFAYGAPGRWEIGLCANATDNSDGTSTFDTILRGAKGTEWATGLHEAYDKFVFLSDADMAFIGVDVNSLGVERLYKGATAGQDIDNVASQAFAYNGVNLKPLSPVHLYGYKSGNNWVLGGIRRSRLENPYFNNGGAVPLGEATEAYQFDIMDGATVVRVIDSATQEITYEEADQIDDFGSVQSSLTFRMVQISATVGRGYETEATV